MWLQKGQQHCKVPQRGWLASRAVSELHTPFGALQQADSDICVSKQDLRPKLARLLTGGLGDVMGALPKAMARRGHRVMCIAPRYANYAEGWDTSVRIQMNVSGSNIEVSFAATSLGYCT